MAAMVTPTRGFPGTDNGKERYIEIGQTYFLCFTILHSPGLEAGHGQTLATYDTVGHASRTRGVTLQDRRDFLRQGRWPLAGTGQQK